jgi:dephospho-CoA kinase
MKIPIVLKIALVGRSGSGKTTIAEYLRQKYLFAICSTGLRCRVLAREFFENESKTTLNLLTDALRKIEPGVWLKVALRDAPESSQRIVIDSIRFPEDLLLVKNQGAVVWRVDCSNELRVERLSRRGQSYNIETDDKHITETALADISVDDVIVNDFEALPDLYDSIDKKLALIKEGA